MLDPSKGPNSKRQFRVRKNLLIEKAPTKMMGDLVIFQIYLTEIQYSGLFYVTGRGNRWGKKVIDHCRHLDTSQSLRKIVVVDVSLVMRFLKILIHSHHFCMYFPYVLIGRGTF